MEIVCSFYIGHQTYLADPVPTDIEGNLKFCSDICVILERNMGLEQFKIYQPQNSQEVKAVLTSGNLTLAAIGFSTETAVAEDELGLPVLFYVNAHFRLSDDYDFDEDDVEATLHIGNHSVSFEGIAEIIDDDEDE